MTATDQEFRSAAKTSLRFTHAGLTLLSFAATALLMSWSLGGTTGLFAATAGAFIVVAPVCAWAHLSGIEVSPPRAARVPAGEHFPLQLSIRNRSRFFGARHVVITSAGNRVSGPPAGHLVALPAKHEKHVTIAHRLQERGRKHTLVLRLSSTYPLGLVVCERQIRLPADFVGLPRIGSLRDIGLPPRRADLLLKSRRARPGNEEFFGVRNWRDGEGLRRVHWRLSARRQRLILREFHEQIEAPVHLLFSTRTEVGNAGKIPSFERSVSLAATVAEHFLRRGRRVFFTIAEATDCCRVPLRGRAGLLRVLTILADVKAVDGDPSESLQSMPARQSRAEEIVVAVLAGARAPHERGAIVLDVTNPSTNDVFRLARTWGLRQPLSPLT